MLFIMHDDSFQGDRLESIFVNSLVNSTVCATKTRILNFIYIVQYGTD